MVTRPSVVIMPACVQPKGYHSQKHESAYDLQLRLQTQGNFFIVLLDFREAVLRCAGKDQNKKH